MDEEGLVTPRTGNLWAWQDHLYNQDVAIIDNTWYYSALKFAKKISDILKNEEHLAFLNERIESIEKRFVEKFWKGSYFSTGNFVDDRANALSVLVGLCPQEYYKDVRKILLTVFNSSIYMENYVLMALCEMGYIEDAYKRMMSRYYNLATNENTTLWEDFYILGTKNHAWSGAPATIFYNYLKRI
jgi:alpha-L-rhamnosidase